MAKKKEGAGQGLIITLVFFVILSLVMGALAYFGYSEQEALTKKAADAVKAKDVAFAEREEEETRKLALRIAMGVEDPNDRKRLEELSASRKEKLLDEVNLIRGKLASLGFQWDNVQVGDTPAPAPRESVVTAYDNMSKNLANARKAEESAKGESNAARASANAAQAAQKAAADKFNADLAALSAKVDALNTKYDNEFKNYVAGLNKQGKDFQAEVNKIADQRDQLEREADPIKKKIAEYKILNDKFMAQQAPDSPDMLKNDTKKGDIIRKDGQFVTISIGANSLLRPNTTFAVLPANSTWRDAREKQKLIKAKLEVVEITGPFTARAKILDEVEPIRNPIQVKDEIYNPAWSANQPIHIAFAGIIDTNGDGYDDNEQYLRMLESMGVKVDAYLDLKTRKIRGPGIGLNTKYLVIGPDAKLLDSGGDGQVNDKDPKYAIISEVGAKMGEMKNRAKELGVQIVEARKFLDFMGVKMPEKMQQPDYGYLSNYPTSDAAPEAPKADAPPAKK